MRKLAIAAAIAAASLSLAASAQPGMGPGTGPGPGAGPGSGMGAGPGPRAGAGPRFDETTTPGWSMMTAQERDEHREKMRSFRNYEECNAYMTENHARMQERARAQGKTLAGGAGPGPACDWLKK
jgi:hypothetical protein